jgi:hypothetical protein
MIDLIEVESPPRTGVVHTPTAVSMNPSIRDEWCEAMESGQYAQNHKGLLRTSDDLFCPLGVLVDIATKYKVVAWDQVSGYYIVNGAENHLPPPVREWAEITGSHPSQDLVLHWGGDFHPIWRLNDHYKMTFDVISHLVRAQY